VELHNRPVPGQKNKFVVTEEEAYFFPVVSGDVPSFADILTEVFDLEDPEVVTGRKKTMAGSSWATEADGGLDIHVPLEQNDYVNERLKEVLGG